MQKYGIKQRGPDMYREKKEKNKYQYNNTTVILFTCIQPTWLRRLPIGFAVLFPFVAPLLTPLDTPFRAHSSPANILHAVAVPLSTFLTSALRLDIRSRFRWSMMLDLLLPGSCILSDPVVADLSLQLMPLSSGMRRIATQNPPLSIEFRASDPNK